MADLTTTISVQIDKKDKEQVTKILQKLGVSMSGLINMTIKQTIMKKGIPFEVTIPEEDAIYDFFTKEELEETAKELDYIEKHPEEYKGYDNWEDLKEALLSDD